MIDPDILADDFLKFLSDTQFKLSFYHHTEDGLKFRLRKETAFEDFDKGNMEDFEHLVRSWMAETGAAQATQTLVSNLLKTIRSKADPHFAIKPRPRRAN